MIFFRKHTQVKFGMLVWVSKKITQIKRGGGIMFGLLHRH